jgi:hypothetical protein
VPASTVSGLNDADVARHFTDRGLEVTLTLVDDDEATTLRPVRADLHETTFVARPALIGA